LGSLTNEETRAKMSASKKGNSNGQNQPNSLKIQVTDLEKDTKTIYSSMCEAAKALNINVGTISRYFSNNGYQKKPYKKRYVFIITKIDS
jgi:DNA invertase Pin-like site-specific DNA recombinase